MLAARRVAPIPARSSTSPVSEMEPGTRFRQSFTPVVRLKPKAKHQLKHHFRGCIREVVGYLDSLAARDPERFVWPTPEAVVKHCNRFKGKRPYKLRMVKYVLAFLREQFVLERVTRFRFGALRDGYIVAPHDCFTERKENECFWVGYSAERAAAAAIAVHTAVHSAVHTAVHSETPCCALETGKIDLQPDSVSTTCKGPADASLVSKPLEPLLTVRTELVLTGSQAQVEKTKTEKPVVQSGYEQQLTDKPPTETIGEHFDIVDWDSITEGRLVFDVVKIMAGYDKKVWDKLLRYCRGIVERRAAQPYAGPRTNYEIMDEAQSWLTEKERPRAWFKILMDLKRDPSYEPYRPPVVTAADFSKPLP